MQITGKACRRSLAALRVFRGLDADTGNQGAGMGSSEEHGGAGILAGRIGAACVQLGHIAARLPRPPGSA